jgi:hypothetical protein
MDPANFPAVLKSDHIAADMGLRAALGVTVPSSLLARADGVIA